MQHLLEDVKLIGTRQMKKKDKNSKYHQTNGEFSVSSSTIPWPCLKRQSKQAPVWMTDCPGTPSSLRTRVGNGPPNSLSRENPHFFSTVYSLAPQPLETHTPLREGCLPLWSKELWSQEQGVNPRGIIFLSLSLPVPWPGIQVQSWEVSNREI